MRVQEVSPCYERSEEQHGHVTWDISNATSMLLLVTDGAFIGHGLDHSKSTFQ